MKRNKKPLAYQIGGNHYKSFKIQPIEVIQDFGLRFEEGSALKYITRWRKKGGILDLQKARHFLEFATNRQEATCNYTKLLQFASQLSTKESVIASLICDHNLKGALELLDELILIETSGKVDSNE